MFPEYPNLDEIIDWSCSRFGKPQFDRTSIRVPVRMLRVGKDYPGYSKSTLLEKAVLVFEGVSSSERAISEYGDPQIRNGRRRYEIVKSYPITDGPFDTVNEQAYLFYIGGVSDDPHAWIEWEIVAVTVRVEVVDGD